MPGISACGKLGIAVFPPKLPAPTSFALSIGAPGQYAIGQIPRSGVLLAAWATQAAPGTVWIEDSLEAVSTVT
jgi:hypothetical protein